MDINDIKKQIDKLSLNEKIGQISQNIFGWEVYKSNTYEITDVFYKEIEKYKTIGAIYGVLRSDPWSKVTWENGIKPSDSLEVLEKLSIIASGESVIKPFFVEEVSHGHQGLGASCLPVNLAIGCTFNPDLYKESLAHVAKELKAKGANIALLSCLDLALDPRWGRSEECYGEDTYLSMKLIDSAIKGLQGDEFIIDKNHVGVVVKHFIGQGSSLGGHNGKSVSLGFNDLLGHHVNLMQVASNAKALGVMVAYNDIDALPCHINHFLLQDILRNDIKFEGFTMSDGCALDQLTDFIGSPEEVISVAIKSGINMDLWNKCFNSLPSAIKQGLISESDLDYPLEKILSAKDRLGLLDDSITYPKYDELDFNKIKELNYKLACESLVLLKNDKSVLPLKNLKNVCLIGPYIDNIYHQLGDYTAFQDLNKIKSLSEILDIPSAKGSFGRKRDSKLLREAIELAKENKYVVLNIGSSSMRNFDVKFDSNGAAIIDNQKYSDMDCGEGMDVAEVALNSVQLELFEEIYKVNKNIILLITSGRPIGIEKIKDRSIAIIQSFYGGTEIGRAVKDTLIGLNNPSGRLSISIPVNSAQLPVYYWKRDDGDYVDQSSKPTYSFGDGMSYANISMNIDKFIKIKNHQFLVKVEIQNNSDIDALWPVLVFGKLRQTIIKPPRKVLVGFKKIEIKANEKLKIEIPLDLGWLYKHYGFENIEFILD